MTPTVLVALILLLAAVLIGSLYFAFAGPDETRLRLAGLKSDVPDISAAASIEARRKTVQNVLKGIDKKAASTTEPKSTLRQRLDRAGLINTTAKQFWLFSAGLGVVVLVLCLMFGEPLLSCLLLTFAAGLGLPRWALGFLLTRRQRKFTNDFADAMDVIVRSVQAGLPSHEALKMVAKDFRDPVGGEFQRLVDSMLVGLTMELALKRMYDSVPTAEVGFFSVVMSVQQKAGGNLAEALSNLSSVLRDRKRLQGRIKSMSSEAKSTAWIIGSLPVGVMGLLYAIAPNYISLLFTERAGNFLLLGCVLWMGLGSFIMRQMINFKH
ncbi:MAG: type II secretion system F family protein [Rhizomicrobium sp.]